MIDVKRNEITPYPFASLFLLFSPDNLSLTRPRGPFDLYLHPFNVITLERWEPCKVNGALSTSHPTTCDSCARSWISRTDLEVRTTISFPRYEKQIDCLLRTTSGSIFSQ
jgi:hypothetical protein